MTIDFQTLRDALFAVLTTVGIAVALSVALGAAAAFLERGKSTVTPKAGPAQHATQAEEPRELILH